MVQLKVKTRGGSSPQGKQKVYFCCHPADFSAFFEPVSEEILARQNCAVWYADPATPRDEAFLDDLKEMQLFVMPVTSRLLHSDNYALTVEFPFAIAHHIPVLPLMQEAGLKEVFNQKCGDLQFLDTYNTDPTALPYEEKLDKYLSGVLVGDALAEKVRAAFDAYVFLSYRKKDRKYAQELMRLIHKNPFCRAIALWYDEFLTPGENFNDAIRAALEKSGLFVLAVTPNLVNEPNYIQRIEYPMAVEQEKPILPAEMVSTDADELADKYPGLPPVADAHDESALSAALLEAVRKLAIEENDRSPQHNFFIGLAYLSGIDVEVDHHRAVALITGAAEAGLAEAVEKLVDMYWNGIGVMRNYEAAIRWQEKLVAIAEAAYAETPSEETLSTLFWRLMYCGDYCEELWRSDKAKAWYVKGEAVIRTAPFTENSYVLRRGWFSVCHRLGAIFRGEGNLPEARRQYEQALSICEKNAAGHGAADARRNLAVCHHDLGCICQAEGDLPQAKRHFEQALAVIEQIVAQVGSETVRRDTATICHNLGKVCLAEENRTDARRYGERALAIQTSLLAESDSAAVWRDVASSYQLLGDICRADNDAPQARE
ncbi:MAG: toll/interleukin-1 receptor domain-containing protein [Clostridia bacterium]|nr:toll/interleukin-1 receptor domain-containing protein [Clostridia bacterium]